MNNYIILCTEEQTRKAYELGAPLNFDYHADDFQNVIKIANKLYAEVPTAEEMIGWLHTLNCIVYTYPIQKDHKTILTARCTYITDRGTTDAFYGYGEDNSVVLKAIDAALEYLINDKK